MILRLWLLFSASIGQYNSPGPLRKYALRPNQQTGRYEDGSFWLRDLPIEIKWTDKQVAYLGSRYNVVIPYRSSEVDKKGRSYPFNHHSTFPVNYWPRSGSKPITVIPVLVSNDFPQVYIKHVYEILNSLTTQAECVEFRWITFDEIVEHKNWILLAPGQKCLTHVGLPSLDEGFHGGEVKLELGSDCLDSNAVLRSMILHAVGLVPEKVSGRKTGTTSPSAYKLCSKDGIYSVPCSGQSCVRSPPAGYALLRKAVPYEEAMRACSEEFGMQLTRITTPEEARVVAFLLQSDDQGLERAKFWTGNKLADSSTKYGEWRGLWAQGYPLKQYQNAPVYQSYSAGHWEWRNDLEGISKLPALCEAKSEGNSNPKATCRNNLCSTQAVCTPKGSAYSCRCSNGFYGNGFKCTPTSCPQGTVRSNDQCIKDPCNSCKPRFACIGQHLGTPSQRCVCKAGWTGNGIMCLPKKQVSTDDINDVSSVNENGIHFGFDNKNVENSIARKTIPRRGTQMSGGRAALASLAQKLNQMKAPHERVTMPTTQTPAKMTTPTQSAQPPRHRWLSEITAKVPKLNPSVTESASLSSPPAVHHAIDYQKLKSEMTAFAEQVAQQSASSIETRVNDRQKKMREEVDSVLELVQTFISQSETERETLASEVDRLRKYTDYFSDRINKMADNMDDVESIKKSAQMEREHFDSLSSIAQSLRDQIDTLQSEFGTVIEDTDSKVSQVVEKVVETATRVDIAESDSKMNTGRIMTAERRLNDVESVSLRSLQTENEVQDNQEHLLHLDSWMANLDNTIVDAAHTLGDVMDVNSNQQDEIIFVEQEIKNVENEQNKSKILIGEMDDMIHQREQKINQREDNLESMINEVKQETGSFSADLQEITDDVDKNYVAFEVGLRHAATSAAHASKTAQTTKTELVHFMKRQGRFQQTVSGKINRQNDLLAFLMNQVKKLEQQLGESKGNTQAKEIKNYRKNHH